MITDDGIRADDGVVACLRNTNDVEFWLVFDDVKSDNKSNTTKWTPQDVFAWHAIDKEKLKNLELEEYEFAAIGRNLIIRLLALSGELK